MSDHDQKIRCGWEAVSDQMREYHDTEWGVPLYDDQKLFEFLVLDGMQAGLSWATVLRKRPAFRAAFDEFDPENIAAYDQKKINDLLHNPGIIRNRLKIESAIHNAQALIKLSESVPFHEFLWSYMNGKPMINHWHSLDQLPAQTPLSQKLSKDLKNLGFRFVGPTIVYAFMQAAGLINDHLVSCFRHQEVNREAR